jgi:trigger factor
MQVSIETTNGLGRKLTIQVPAERIDKEITTRLAELAKKVKIDGFRPGKVPQRVVKQRFSSSVKAEVARELVQSTLYEALQEKDLTPAGTPAVDPGVIHDGKDFEYTATFEVFPEINIAELEGVDVERVNAAVSDADVTNMLEKLREQHKEWVEVEVAAKDGDKINIDFDGYVDGEAFEGGKAEGYDLVLGSGSMIPGFESGLVGLKVADEKDLDVTFPADYNQKDLAGKAAVFKIKVNKVLGGKLPEIDDTFIQKFDEKGGTVESFKADVQKNMGRELKRQVIQLNKEKVFDAFLEKNPIELPAALVDREIEHLKKDMLNRVFGGKQADMSKLPALPREMFEVQAKRRVHLGLVFSEYVKVHDIHADKSRVDGWLKEHSEGYEKPEEVLNWYQSSKERMAEVEGAVMEEQVIEKMVEKAKIKDVKLDYDAVMDPKPAATDA